MTFWSWDICTGAPRPPARPRPSCSRTYCTHAAHLARPALRRRAARMAQIRAPSAEISCTSRVSRPKPVRRCLLRTYRSPSCVVRRRPRHTPVPRPHASRQTRVRLPGRRTVATPHRRHHCLLRRRPGPRRRRRLQHRVGLLRARLPPGLHLTLAQDALGLPALQPRVGVCEDREDRDLRQPRLIASAARAGPGGAACAVVREFGAHFSSRYREA